MLVLCLARSQFTEITVAIARTRIHTNRPTDNRIGLQQTNRRTPADRWFTGTFLKIGLAYFVMSSYFAHYKIASVNCKWQKYVAKFLQS